MIPRQESFIYQLFFFLPPCNNKLKLPTEKKALFVAQCVIVRSIPFVAFIGGKTHSISSHIEVYVLAHSWFSRLPLLTCWVNTSTLQLFQFVAVGFNCPLQLKKLVYVYLVRYAEEQQDLALLSISTFQRALKVALLLYGYSLLYYVWSMSRKHLFTPWHTVVSSPCRRTQTSSSGPVRWGFCPASVSPSSSPSWCWPSRRLRPTCPRMSGRRLPTPSRSSTGTCRVCNTAR